MFHRSYGHDTMFSETRDALYYAQLQEGLKYDLMKAPAVSGVLDYQTLCVAAKSEERHKDQPRGTKKAPNQPTPGSQLRLGQSHNRSTGASQSKQGQNAASRLTQGGESAGIAK